MCNEKYEDKKVLRTIKYLFSIIISKRPSFLLSYMFEILIMAFSPFISIFFSKMIIDQLSGDRRIKLIIIYTACIIGGGVFVEISTHIINYFKSINQEWSDEFFSRNLSKKAMSMDFEHTETPDVLDQMNKAKTGMSWYSKGVSGIADTASSIISSILTLLGVVVIIVMKCPWLLILQFLSLVIISVLNLKINKVQMQSHKSLSDLNRRFQYIFWELSNFKYGKDIRLYNAHDMMLNKADHFNQKTTQAWKKQFDDSLKYNQGISILNAIRDGVNYIYIGYLAIINKISLGEFSMYISSTTTFYWSMHAIVAGVQKITLYCNYAYEYVKFMNYTEAMKKGNDKLSANKKPIIEFRNVSFKYPRTNDYVLQNISIKINFGEHLSIVGLNGSGKTTFIKLLCRLYDVNNGEILLDGKNIMDYDEDEYRKLFSVIFQDYQLFAFSIKENIILDETDIPIEELGNILNKSGLLETVENLPKKENTIIYKIYDEEGVELSGGQQQKLAIARALHKKSSVVILDEPTASLDPVAEYEIYRHFSSLVEGKTAIYISHRLSSCKFCDKIAVFADKSIVEYGTHEELIKIEDGIYYEMFKSQAQYYV